ncbi:MAG: hypothetical protein IJU21_06440, partial [Bacteroidales bacterium]|nr:hypothetical protein [Bacteroidales bacterium]
IILVDGDKYVAETGAADTQVYLGRLGFTETGKYTLTVNLNTMTLTAVKEGGDVPGPDFLYLVGGCFTPSWSFSNDLVLTKGEGGIYTAEDILMEFGDNKDNGFRIYTVSGTWSLCYTYTSHSEDGIQLYYDDVSNDPPQIYPGQYGYEDSVYNLTFNISTMVLTLTPSVKWDLEVLH